MFKSKLTIINLKLTFLYICLEKRRHTFCMYLLRTRTIYDSTEMVRKHFWYLNDTVISRKRKSMEIRTIKIIVCLLNLSKCTYGLVC